MPTTQELLAELKAIDKPSAPTGRTTQELLAELKATPPPGLGIDGPIYAGDEYYKRPERTPLKPIAVDMTPPARPAMRDAKGATPMPGPISEESADELRRRLSDEFLQDRLADSEREEAGLARMDTGRSELRDALMGGPPPEAQGMPAMQPRKSPPSSYRPMLAGHASNMAAERDPSELLPTVKALPGALNRQGRGLTGAFAGTVPKALRSGGQLVAGLGEEVTALARASTLGDLAPETLEQLENWWGEQYEAYGNPGKLERTAQEEMEYGLEGLSPTVRGVTENVGYTAAQTIPTLAAMSATGGALPPGQAIAPTAGGLLPAAGVGAATQQTRIIANAARMAVVKAVATPGDIGERVKAATTTFAYMSTPAVSGLMKTRAGAVIVDIMLNQAITHTMRAMEPGEREAAYKDPDVWFSTLMDVLMSLSTQPLGPGGTRAPTTDDVRAKALQALGLKDGATEADITTAFRKIVKANHPDLNPQQANAEAVQMAVEARDFLVGKQRPTQPIDMITGQTIAPKPTQGMDVAPRTAPVETGMEVAPQPPAQAPVRAPQADVAPRVELSLPKAPASITRTYPSRESITAAVEKLTPEQRADVAQSGTSRKSFPKIKSLAVRKMLVEEAKAQVAAEPKTMWRASTRHGEETAVGPYGFYGIHLGTRAQAEVSKGQESGRTVKQYRVTTNNPIRLTDSQVQHPIEVAKELAKRGLIDADRVGEFRWGNSPEQDRRLINLLKSFGYDSIVYSNKAEGPGDSVIVFDTTQMMAVGEPAAPKAQVAKEAEVEQAPPAEEPDGFKREIARLKKRQDDALVAITDAAGDAEVVKLRDKSSGNYLLLHPASAEGRKGQYQVSSMNSEGTPTGHHFEANREDALKSVVGISTDSGPASGSPGQYDVVETKLAPKPKQPAPEAVDSTVRDVVAAYRKYDDTGEIGTVAELAEKIRAIAENSDSPKAQTLIEAADAYDDEVAENHSVWGGRGDQDDAEDAFIDAVRGVISPQKTPARTEAQPEGAQAVQDVMAAYRKYDDTGEIGTVAELVEEIRGIAEDSDAPRMRALIEAADAYDAEIAENHFEWGDRGDQDSAEDAFMDAVRHATGPRITPEAQPEARKALPQPQAAKPEQVEAKPPKKPAGLVREKGGKSSAALKGKSWRFKKHGLQGTGWEQNYGIGGRRGTFTGESEQWHNPQTQVDEVFYHSVGADGRPYRLSPYDAEVRNDAGEWEGWADVPDWIRSGTLADEGTIHTTKPFKTRYELREKLDRSRDASDLGEWETRTMTVKTPTGTATRHYAVIPEPGAAKPIPKPAEAVKVAAKKPTLLERKRAAQKSFDEFAKRKDKKPAPPKKPAGVTREKGKALTSSQIHGLFKRSVDYIESAYGDGRASYDDALAALQEKERQIKAQPGSRTPKSQDSLYLYTPKARKRIDDITWAIARMTKANKAVVKRERIDGVEYELTKIGGGKGVVRVYDAGANELVTLRTFPTLAAARKEYDKTLSVLKKPAPAKTPTILDPGKRTETDIYESALGVAADAPADLRASDIARVMTEAAEQGVDTRKFAEWLTEQGLSERTQTRLDGYMDKGIMIDDKWVLPPDSTPAVLDPGKPVRQVTLFGVRHIPAIPDVKMNTPSAQTEYDALKKLALNKNTPEAKYQDAITKLAEMQNTGDLPGQSRMFETGAPKKKERAGLTRTKKAKPDAKGQGKMYKERGLFGGVKEQRSLFSTGQPAKRGVSSQKKEAEGELPRGKRASGVRWERGVATHGAAIKTSFKAKHRVDIAGLSVKNAAEVAAVGQIWRNPKYETLWIVYADADGVAVNHEGVSCREPGLVEWPSGDAGYGAYKRIAETAAKSGAKAVWMLHNHPTGSVEPSSEDIAFTRSWKGKLAAAAEVFGVPLEFKGHVVIDHDKYAFIEPRLGTFATFDLPVKHRRGADLLKAEIPHPLLHKRVRSASAAAFIGKQLLEKPGRYFTAMHIGSRTDGTRGLQSVPIEFFADYKSAKEWLRLQRVKFGSPSTILYTPNVSALAAETQANLVRLVANGHLLDVVDERGTSAHSELVGQGKTPGERDARPEWVRERGAAYVPGKKLSKKAGVLRKKAADKLEAVEKKLASLSRKTPGADVAAAAEKIKAIEGKATVRPSKVVLDELRATPDVALVKRIQRLKGNATPAMKEAAETITEARAAMRAIRAEITPKLSDVTSAPVLDTLDGIRIGYRPGKGGTDFGTEIHEALQGKGTGVRRYFKRLKAGEVMDGIHVHAIDEVYDYINKTDGLPSFENETKLLEHIIAAAEDKPGTDFYTRLEDAAREEKLQMDAYDAGPEDVGEFVAAWEKYQAADTAVTVARDRAITEFADVYAVDLAPRLRAELDRIGMSAQRAAAIEAEVIEKEKALAQRERDILKTKIAEIETEAGLKGARQSVMASAIRRGFAKRRGKTTFYTKQLRDMIKKHSGKRSLSPVKDPQQLAAILAAVQRARPQRIGQDVVVKPKTERKLKDLKVNLIRKGRLTPEIHEHQKAMLQIRTTEYVNPQNYITEKNAHALIRKMLDDGVAMQWALRAERALKRNPTLRGMWDAIQKRDITPKRVVEGEGEGGKVSTLQDMRYYMQRVTALTGDRRFYDLYRAMARRHREIERAIEDDRSALVEAAGGKREFGRIAQSKTASKRVRDYLWQDLKTAQKPAYPKDITKTEIRVAEALRDIFKRYENHARRGKFLTLFDKYGERAAEHHEEWLPDAPKQDVQKAVDILESQGYDGLYKYLDGQTWGVIKGGYTPERVITHKMQLRRMAPTSYARGNIRVREGLQFDEGDRTVFQRAERYMYQIRNLVEQAPLTGALCRTYDENLQKLKDPDKVKSELEQFINEAKGYDTYHGAAYRPMRRTYSDFMAIRMFSPDLALRNMFQPEALYPHRIELWKNILREMPEADRKWFHTYVSQNVGLTRDQFMWVEPPIKVPVPGVGAAYTAGIKLARHLSMYPAVDTLNRWRVYHAKYFSALDALEKHWDGKDNPDMAALDKALGLDDIEPMERQGILETLAADGKVAAAREMARHLSDNTQFMYTRLERAPIEQGGAAKIGLNLLTFSRSYTQQVYLNMRKLGGKKTPFHTRLRAAKWLAGLLIVAPFVGWFYDRLTGKKYNPYSPASLLAYSPHGAGDAVFEPMAEFADAAMHAMAGDNSKWDTMIVSGTKLNDLCIPFYEQTMNAIEAFTNTQQVDRRTLRRLRAEFDSTYKPNDKYYDADRELVESMQKLLFRSEPQNARPKKRKHRARAAGL